MPDSPSIHLLPSSFYLSMLLEPCGFFPKLLRSPHLFDNNHKGQSSCYSKQQGQHLPGSESEQGYSYERSRTPQQSVQLLVYHSFSPGDEIPTYENLSWD